MAMLKLVQSISARLPKGFAMADACSACKGGALVAIDTRTLFVGLATCSPAPRNTEWRTVCRVCAPDQLRGSDGLALPFLAADGVMRTIADATGRNREPRTQVWDFCNLRFTANALDSAIKLVEREDRRNPNHATRAVETLGQHYLAQPDADSALAFSEAVCAWGGGLRVWANLKRFHGTELSSRLDAWLRHVPSAINDETAIAPAVGFTHGDSRSAIKGLGVSFASKHLRMLQPDRFAVLDDIFHQGLGFALNVKGYALFLHELRGFRSRLQSDSVSQCNLASLEGGIFWLVRPWVRAAPGQETMQT